MAEAGERARQRELYEKYSPLIYRRCLRYLHSKEEAQDATSEVFLKMLDHWESVKDGDSILHWIHRVTTNHCISQWRRKKFQAADVEDGFEDDARHADDSEERRIILRDMLNKVMFPWNKATREIVMYTYWDGYTQEEISTLMGIATSTIRKHLTKVRRSTQQWKLEKLEGEHAF